MEKNMAYRIYKKQFDDCKTLNDYDKVKKTITVIIPDDDARLKRNVRVDTKIWKSYGNEWRLKLEAWPEGTCLYSVRKCESGYYAVARQKDKTFKNREDALNWVIENYKKYI